ncbi:MAG: HD domain-containing protein [Candidatus Eremiobacteraeota bacterium]|nr:HD domain-containing protein [Candidatus Eremiobacteraeota bacterium]
MESAALPEERSVLLDTLLHLAVLKLAETEESAELPEFVRWIADELRRNPEVPALKSAVAAFVPAIMTLLQQRGMGDSLPSLRELQEVLFRVGFETVSPSVREEATIDEVDATINGFVLQLEVEDALTAEHSRAVQSWCVRIGRRLGLSPEETTFLGRCGLIHDIGKIRTPKEILTAARGLTQAEWGVMRAHAAVGAKMVSDVALIAPLTPAVRSHHERIDGKGYPDSLAREQIPFSARVVAIADSFNAMIGRRPYRPPRAPSVALEELELHRGTQFDPEITDAMIDVVTRKG